MPAVRRAPRRRRIPIPVPSFLRARRPAGAKDSAWRRSCRCRPVHERAWRRHADGCLQRGDDRFGSTLVMFVVDATEAVLVSGQDALMPAHRNGECLTDVTPPPARTAAASCAAAGRNCCPKSSSARSRRLAGARRSLPCCRPAGRDPPRTAPPRRPARRARTPQSDSGAGGCRGRWAELSLALHDDEVAARQDGGVADVVVVVALDRERPRPAARRSGTPHELRRGRARARRSRSACRQAA